MLRLVACGWHRMFLRMRRGALAPCRVRWDVLRRGSAQSRFEMGRTAATCLLRPRLYASPIYPAMRLLIFTHMTGSPGLAAARLVKRDCDATGAHTHVRRVVEAQRRAV